MNQGEGSSAGAAGVVVIATPVAVGHVRPLMPLARALVERGVTVVWAISGDLDEPAAAWREPLTALGARFVDVDAVAPFTRGPSLDAGGPATLLRRIVGRANDVAEAAAAAIREAARGQPLVAAVNDFFGLWGYAAFRRLGITRVTTLISAFASSNLFFSTTEQDAVYDAEVARLRASGGIAGELEGGIFPVDAARRLVCMTSPRLCADQPHGITLPGVQRESLPRVGELSAAPPEHQALVARLSEARASGVPVLLLSMGTIALRMAARFGAAHQALIERVYTEVTRQALALGGLVVASTSGSTPAALGLTGELDPRQHPRLVSMPFVPQPLLFAHGLVDLMVMHGGANTFHEAMVAGLPLVVVPIFGDQGAVARAVVELGVGAAVCAPGFPDLPGALPLERVCAEVLPELLTSAPNRCKERAGRLAAELATEDGLRGLMALVLA